MDFVAVVAAVISVAGAVVSWRFTWRTDKREEAAVTANVRTLYGHLAGDDDLIFIWNQGPADAAGVLAEARDSAGTIIGIGMLNNLARDSGGKVDFIGAPLADGRIIVDLEWRDGLNRRQTRAYEFQRGVGAQHDQFVSPLFDQMTAQPALRARTVRRRWSRLRRQR